MPIALCHQTEAHMLNEEGTKVKEKGTMKWNDHHLQLLNKFATSTSDSI